MKLNVVVFICLSMFSAAIFAHDDYIAQKPSYRVIVDNDFAGDPDGLAALAHQLVLKKTAVKLVTVTGLNPKFAQFRYGQKNTAKAGKAMAQKLNKMLSIAHVPVKAGHDYIDREGSARPSEAALSIIEEAMRDDPLPLIITVGGPLTNLAEAIKLKPEIASRMSLIWIGGGNYPQGGEEYNLSTDLKAAQYIFQETSIPIIQIPVGAYRQMQYSVLEMRDEFRPISEVTHWIYELYTDLPDFVELGGTLTMGDHPLVLFTALSSESSYADIINAHHIQPDGSYGAPMKDREVTIYKQLDARLTFADFIAALRIHAQKSGQ